MTIDRSENTVGIGSKFITAAAIGDVAALNILFAMVHPCMDTTCDTTMPILILKQPRIQILWFS